MSRYFRVLAVSSLLAIGACAGETATSTTTTSTPLVTTTTVPTPTTTSTLPPVADEGWVTLGPDGLRDFDGTTLWATSVFSWHTLSRDGAGGFVFADDEGLWWLRHGANIPDLVIARDGPSEVVEVIETGDGPVARLGFCDSGYVRLEDGSTVEDPPPGRVEVDCDGENTVRWTAANGLTAEIVGPEFTEDTEGQPDEVAAVAQLVITRASLVLLRTPVGGFYEAWARIHDFDGRRVIVSRGPFEPAIPEETFYLIDLATGETIFPPAASAMSMALRGLDIDEQPEVVEPLYIYQGTPLLTDNLMVDLEDGRYVGYIDHVAASGLTGGPEIHFDLAVWFSGKEADYAASVDGWTDIPVPNDYYIRNQDPTVPVLTVHPDVEVTSVWYHYDQDPTLENRAITFEELVDALTGEPVGPHLNMWHDPWWITIVDGEVIAIDEQYVP